MSDPNVERGLQSKYEEDMEALLDPQPEPKAKPKKTARFEGEVWMSTDGKHTVHIKADTAEGRLEGSKWANMIYDRLVATKGTKADMWEKAINKNGSSKAPVSTQNDNNKPVHICKYHNVPLVWKEGVSKKTGKPYAFWSCPEKTADGGWCDYKPPKV